MAQRDKVLCIKSVLKKGTKDEFYFDEGKIYDVFDIDIDWDDKRHMILEVINNFGIPHGVSSICHEGYDDNYDWDSYESFKEHFKFVD